MSGIRVLKNKALHCYSATKFAVTAIREGIRNELREMKSGIRISVGCMLHFFYVCVCVCVEEGGGGDCACVCVRARARTRVHLCVCV